MPRIVREADVSWEGNLARGTGALTAAISGAFSGLAVLAPDPDRRRDRGEDEPGGAARRRARRLLHDVARG